MAAAVLGNHEMMMMEDLAHGGRLSMVSSDWLLYGGVQTLDSFAYKKNPSEEKDAIKEARKVLPFLRSLPLYLEFGDTRHTAGTTQKQKHAVLSGIVATL
jgi:hypothetical protein